MARQRPNSQELIAAIATPAGCGGIGIVRLSGRGVADCARQLLDRPAVTERICRRNFVDAGGQVIDAGLALLFAAPRSFTGEDVLELHGHGGPAVMRRLLRRCLELGARIAEPGEFSQRAFINGKLDLAQAESIADLINANTERGAKLAAASLRGVLSARADALAGQIMRLRAELEASIDFSDDDISPASLGQLRCAIAQLTEQAEGFLRECTGSLAYGNRSSIALIGAPNAGKSSLLNALCGSPAAIVDAEPGTTRDVVAASCEIRGMAATLHDTAGLRASANAIEQEGMRRARQASADADIVVQVHDVTDDNEPLSAQLHVYNKIDLAGRQPSACGDQVYVSATEGLGLDLLRDKLAELMGAPEQEPGFLARERHAAAVRAALSALADAQQEQAYPEEMAEHLRIAHYELGKISGASDVEALLGEIFARFCIGK